MLSRGDVAEALAVMKRFDRFMTVDDIAVSAWHALLVDVIPDATTLRNAILDAYRTEQGTVTPAHIIAYAPIARELPGIPDMTAEFEAQPRALESEDRMRPSSGWPVPDDVA